MHHQSLMLGPQVRLLLCNSNPYPTVGHRAVQWWLCEHPLGLLGCLQWSTLVLTSLRCERLSQPPPSICGTQALWAGGPLCLQVELLGCRAASAHVSGTAHCTAHCTSRSTLIFCCILLFLSLLCHLHKIYRHSSKRRKKGIHIQTLLLNQAHFSLRNNDSMKHVVCRGWFPTNNLLATCWA